MSAVAAAPGSDGASAGSEGVAAHAILIVVGIAFVVAVRLRDLHGADDAHQALSRAIWPNPFHFHNFYEVFSDLPLLRYTWNTFLIATLSSVGVVLAARRPPTRSRACAGAAARSCSCWCSPR